MPLSDVSDGIIIEDVDGLGPVKATLVSSGFAKMDGKQYHGGSREERNIKFRLLMEPDYATFTVDDVRNRLYGFFMPKTAVDLVFRKDDGREFGISGIVESCEPPMFVKEPAMDVSILCFDPDFFLLGDEGYPDVVLLSQFSVNDSTTFEIDYKGTVETGIDFTLMPDRAVTQFTIYNEWPDGSNNNLDFAADIQAFDHLSINTTPGEKEVTQYRSNNILAHPLYGVSPQSAWTELRPGINTLRVYTTGAPVHYLLSYKTRHGGL